MAVENMALLLHIIELEARMNALLKLQLVTLQIVSKLSGSKEVEALTAGLVEAFEKDEVAS